VAGGATRRRTEAEYSTLEQRLREKRVSARIYMEAVYTPTYSSWLNAIEAHFTPLKKLAVAAPPAPGLVITARSDALAPNGWDDALARARAYYEAGADMAFLDGLKTREDIEYAASRSSSITGSSHPRRRNSSASRSTSRQA
jgi:hypothetical protein